MRKPIGSIRCAVCAKCGEVGSFDVFEDYSNIKLGFFEDRPNIFIARAFAVKCNKCGEAFIMGSEDGSVARNYYPNCDRR